VAAGNEHTVAVRASGTLWAWGRNAEGQLGNDTQVFNFNTPQQIGTDTNWQLVAAGYDHTAAVRTDGTLWIWGDSINAPQQIDSNTNWHSVAVGSAHTIALRTDGTLWAWGDNNSGQLGNEALVFADTPKPIATETAWKAIAAGRIHTLALREDGTLFAWGANSSGQLGDGTVGSVRPSPAPVGINANWLPNDPSCWRRSVRRPRLSNRDEHL
jgi:alpha-tubulin suppressor-like RCC1 family protein